MQKFRVLSDPSTKVEAYFEGADNVFEGAEVNFNSKKIALREIGATNKHAYTNSQIAGHGVVDTSSLNNTDTFTRTAHEFQVGDEVIYIQLQEPLELGLHQVLNTIYKMYLMLTVSKFLQLKVEQQ